MNTLELSIQIRLGGFSFSVRQNYAEVSSGTIEGFDFSMLDSRRWGAEAYDAASVWCDVPWATLVPMEVYRPESTERYLEAMNLLGTDREAMAVQSGAAAVVWAVDRRAVQAFRSAVAAHTVEWSHPLAWLLAYAHSDTIAVWAGEEATHAAVFDREGLVAARSFAAACPDDVLYALVQMSRRVDPDRTFGVWAVGTVDAALETTLRSVYGRATVVNDPLALVRAR